MKYQPRLDSGTLLKRYKRFLADVELENGEHITIHCPNTGAMTGCAEPGVKVYFSTSDNKKRKYPNTFELSSNSHGHLIGVNTAKANHIVKEAIESGLVSELKGYEQLATEVKYGSENSRIDIKLTDPNRSDCYIEIKSTTLLLDADNNLGGFPDAVTTRGQKHLRELAEVVEQGDRAVLVFLVQHTGIKRVTVAAHIDPTYAEQLQKAYAAGVEILVLHTHITPDEIKVISSSEFVWPNKPAN